MSYVGHTFKLHVVYTLPRRCATAALPLPYNPPTLPSDVIMPAVPALDVVRCGEGDDDVWMEELSTSPLMKLPATEAKVCAR